MFSFLAEVTAPAANAQTLDFFRQLAGANNWCAIAPEIAVAALALLVLAADILFPKAWRGFVPSVATLGLTGIIGWIVAAPSCVGAGCDANAAGVIFGGMIRQTGGFPPNVLRLFFLLAAIFVIFIGARYLKKRALPVSEFLHVVLVVTSAMMLLVQSNNFVLFFVALEAITVGFYVLVGFNRNSEHSLEAGVKYLVMGGLSSALLLMGIVLLYGAAGNPALNGGATDVEALGFAFLREFIAANATNPLVLAGASLVIGGVAFKIGMFPFQIWVPDVYQGAPTPTTMFLAVASKAAGIFAFLMLLVGPFFALIFTSDGVGPLFWLVAGMTGLTLIFSNITALGQTNVKRLMGLSGISHAGFLLLAILATLGGSDLAPYALLIYLFAYLAGALATFGVIAEMPGNDALQEISDYNRLMKRSPFLARILACGVGSLAGIPPSFGFVAKFLVILAAFQAGFYCLTAIALLCVCAGVYYYFAWLREAFQRIWTPAEQEAALIVPIPVPVGIRLVLSLLAVIILLGGIVQGFL